jgi:NADH-quinone oxidoreductase subunit M
MELSDMGGLAKAFPFMCGILLTAGMASLGLPGLSGFVSEFMSFLGLFDTLPVVAAIGALGIILTAAYVLRAVMRISFGPMKDRFAVLNDARFIEAVPMVTLLAFIILIGVYPSALSETLKTTVETIAQNFGGRIGG